jgi:hypothetical protein
MSESILFVVMAFMYAVGVFGVVLYGGSVYRGGFRDVMSGLPSKAADIKRASRTTGTRDASCRRRLPHCNCCGVLLLLAAHHHGDGRYPVSAATDPEPADPAGDSE